MAGFARLHEVQLQRAQLSAAQKRLQRAKLLVERLQEALPEEQASKRARSTAEAAETDEEPTWRSWDLRLWRKHEAETQKRRQVKVDVFNT